MKPINNIFFHYMQWNYRVRESFKIKAVIAKIFIDFSTSVERVDYVFCSAKYLLGLNTKFLKHRSHTDIITFSLQDIGKPVIGEIYISVDRVKENAKKYKISVREEFSRVIFHGALHLCGVKDKTRRDKKVMINFEDFYLAHYTNLE